MAKKVTPGTESGTAAGTGSKKGGVDIAQLVAQAAAAGLGGVESRGPVFTRQEAVSYVQGVYQQLLGRNAAGAEVTKGVNIFINQSQDTSATGRQAALVEAVQGSQEFKVRKENTYLDAIYNAIEADVRKAQA